MSQQELIDGIGSVLLWGFTPALDLLSFPTTATALPEGPLNFLLVHAGDSRHLLKTIASFSEHFPFLEHKNITFYILERAADCLARQLLQLATIEDPTRDLASRAHFFLDTYGNCLVEEPTVDHIAALAASLRRFVTGGSQPSQLFPRTIVDLSQLKARDRDELDLIFRSYLPSHGSFASSAALASAHTAPVDILLKRDERVRQYYGKRYDHRSNLVDWDYHFKLREWGCAMIGEAEYRQWRLTGYAFQLRDGGNSKLNPTVATLVKGRQAGAEVSIRGFWGDIANSPYMSFGLQSSDPDYMRIRDGKYTYTATARSLTNLRAIAGSFDRLPALCPLPEAPPQSPETAGPQTGEASQPAVTQTPLEVGSIRVVPLMGTLPELLKKSRYRNLFHGVLLDSTAMNTIPLLGDLVSLEGAVVTVEGVRMVADLAAEAKREYWCRVRAMVAEAGWQLVEERRPEQNVSAAAPLSTQSPPRATTSSVASSDPVIREEQCPGSDGSDVSCPSPHRVATNVKDRPMQAETPIPTPATPSSRSQVDGTPAASPTVQRLQMLSERFSGFHTDLETEAQQRRQDDEIRVQSIRDVVSKIEKNLTMEIKRRQEADRALQNLLEMRVNSLQEALESDLKDKLRQIMTAVESLNGRVQQIEHDVKDEKESRQKELEDTNALLLRQLNTLQNTFEMEKMSRMERETQILKRMSDDVFRLQEKIDGEKLARETGLAQLRDEMQEGAQARTKVDEKMRAHFLEEIASLHAQLQAEQQAREANEEQIVATVEDVVSGLQDGLHVITH
ncbi:putative Dynein assembly factor 3; axonemal [Paratrimastix pyriformis]|uniref:Dynein assembly factor 3 n=1 Tax=Paratrimastix pyriformis TaxID=342808 RepID=A0ABQ8UBP4_9EUKA|nr:putative Dynein assembly factor 3; axonemal [Paratrimastix pyriformis]